MFRRIIAAAGLSTVLVAPGAAQQATGSSVAARPTLVVFITIDPERDTPALLKGYVPNFGAGIIGLTGTKFGCGIEECSACTVLINGSPQKACDEDMAEIPAGASITTIEGLSVNRTHKVQQAWIAEQVPQCGWCQSGAILRAVSLLNTTPNPTDAQIDAAISNICACGTYPRMRAAIHRAAGM